MCFSTPKAPKAPPVMPEMPKLASQSVQQAGQDDRRRRLASGRQSTIIAGTQAAPAMTQQKTLLGG